uniref:Uncharacterized protein n=1 Tax=Timema poppense TaxID=170557 RepID=A0A7R9HAM1_TIMPO|nr:unnamed protein product [Timema poppensis]
MKEHLRRHLSFHDNPLPPIATHVAGTVPSPPTATSCCQDGSLTSHRDFEPPWLHAIAEGTGADFIHSSKDGRTYLASRYLNDGKGAFSYMAISVADQEPLFVPLSEG